MHDDTEDDADNVTHTAEHQIEPDDPSAPKHDLLLFEKTGRYLIALRISRKRPTVIMTVSSSTRMFEAHLGRYEVEQIQNVFTRYLSARTKSA